MRSLIASEHEEQCAVIQWADIAANLNPKLRLLYAVPNGGQRHKAVAGKLKAEGVKKGVPDLVLPVALNGYHGLYIELKRVKKGKVSDNQSTWLDALNKEGYLAVVCKGADDAINTLKKYLSI